MSKKSVKKSKTIRKPAEPKITVDQAMRFLEDARTLYLGLDEPTVAISIRIPANVLRSFRAKASFGGRKYQSAIVELMRKWVSEK
jgi:uncharacterized protein (DUF4415 family)